MGEIKKWFLRFDYEKYITGAFFDGGPYHEQSGFGEIVAVEGLGNTNTIPRSGFRTR